MRTNDFFLDGFLVADAREEDDEGVRECTEEGDDEATDDTGMEDLQEEVGAVGDGLGAEGDDDTVYDDEERVSGPCLAAGEDVAEALVQRDTTRR